MDRKPPYKPDIGLDFDSKASSAVTRSFILLSLVKIVEVLNLSLGKINILGLELNEIDTKFVLGAITSIAYYYFILTYLGLLQMYSFGTYRSGIRIKHNITIFIKRKANASIFISKKLARIIHIIIFSPIIIVYMMLIFIYFALLFQCIGYFYYFMKVILIWS